MKMTKLTYFALIASATAIRHACDYIDDAGEEISTSLMPENIQLSENIGMTSIIDSNHATDYIDDNGDEISTSLMPENV